MSSLTPLAGGKPSISIRKSIAWSSTHASEDSSVLVLSSHPCTRTEDTDTRPFVLYLDLRLSLPLDRSPQINWAFAGIRWTLQTEPNLKYKWEHVIDSRAGMGGGDVVDEGETKVVRDETSGKEIEIETGVGWNPQSGKTETYEELWSDESISPTDPYIFLTLGPSVEQSTGFMAILGPHALSLSQEDGKPFQAVRMHRSPPSMQWKVVYSSSSGAIEELSHCLCMLPGTWNHGQSLELFCEDGSRSWTVFDSGPKVNH